MKNSVMSILTRGVLPLGAMMVLVPVGALRADVATTAPVERTEQELMQAVQEDGGTINRLIGDDAVMRDPGRRQAVAGEAIPLLKRFAGELHELAKSKPAMARQAKSMGLHVTQSLAVLGDKDATDRLSTMAASSDTAESLAGQATQSMVRWILSGKDASAQGQVADQIEKLDRAHTDNTSLTVATYQMSESAATPALSDRLINLVTTVMNNPAVEQIKSMQAVHEGAAKLKKMENTPFALKGKTYEGKAFSTEDFKGKVILVDFWATWCGPCKAELPTVQKLYQDKHADGFEVVGVSNDFSVDSLREFIIENNMPWPELIDAEAAASQQWNPITLGYGITGIPHMFVIDKKGVLRSSDARENYTELVSQLLAE